MGGNPTTTLPANQRQLPGPYDPEFWRGDAWGVPVPGLPLLPGLTSAEHPERCLTWFLGHPLWKDWIDLILTAHAECGFTHFTLGYADNRDACGLSDRQYRDLSAYVRSWGFDVHHHLGSKVFDPANQTWDGYWRDRLTPVLALLTAARAAQHVSFWEWNLWNIPGQVTEDVIAGVSALTKPFGVRQWMHNGPEATWWGAAPDNRFTWWDRMAAGHGGPLTGLLYQIDCFSWNNGMRQARIRDTTDRQEDTVFASGAAKFVAWEVDAALMFSGDQPDQAHAAADAYLLLCTNGRAPVSGASGAWLPDGTPTLKAA